MKTMDYIRMTLEQSRGMMLGLAGDLKALPASTKLPDSVHHPVWILGHAIVSEAGMVAQFLLGENPSLSKWQGAFGPGSQPLADASQYPSMAELFSEYDRVRARTLEVLAGISEADLEKPSKAPPEFARLFGTVGQCLAMLSLHAAFHAGQMADARRALGRAPLFR